MLSCIITDAYSPVTSRRWINHVNTGGSAEDLAVTDGMWDVDVSIHTAFDKLHVVFSQSARLISKHILHLGGKQESAAITPHAHLKALPAYCAFAYTHLPELFIQIRSVHLCARSQLFVKHLLVPGNEIGAQELLHLYCHIHWHWNDVIKQDHEGQEVCESTNHLKSESEQLATVIREMPWGVHECELIKSKLNKPHVSDAHFPSYGCTMVHLCQETTARRTSRVCWSPLYLLRCTDRLLGKHSSTCRVEVEMSRKHVKQMHIVTSLN